HLYRSHSFPTRRSSDLFETDCFGSEADRMVRFHYEASLVKLNLTCYVCEEDRHDELRGATRRDLRQPGGARARFPAGSRRGAQLDRKSTRLNSSHVSIS